MTREPPLLKQVLSARQRNGAVRDAIKVRVKRVPRAEIPFQDLPRSSAARRELHIRSDPDAHCDGCQECQPGHSRLSFAVRMTAPHFMLSVWTNWANCSGEPRSGS